MVRKMIKTISLINHTNRIGQVNKYKVIGSDNNNFMLDHPTKRKVFLRHEIRK